MTLLEIQNAVDLKKRFWCDEISTLRSFTIISGSGNNKIHLINLKIRINGDIFYIKKPILMSKIFLYKIDEDIEDLKHFVKTFKP
jgi:hypothetical protein